MKTNLIILAACIGLNVATAVAQTSPKRELLYSNRFSILFGLLQPLALKGGNVEVNYFTKRMSFDYSHGFSLDPPVVGTFKDKKLALHIPYTTGFGVGYRFSSFFDVRFEPKLHSWEVYADTKEQIATNRIAKFQTFTLGLGAYYRYMPFRNSTSQALQGITTNVSVRYWQNVGTTLSNDEFTYADNVTGKKETMKAPNIGLANTPLIINFAIGYTFGGK